MTATLQVCNAAAYFLCTTAFATLYQLVGGRRSCAAVSNYKLLLQALLGHAPSAERGRLTLPPPDRHTHEEHASVVAAAPWQNLTHKSTNFVGSESRSWRAL